MGIFSPELVVYCAWYQWNDARKLTAAISGLRHGKTNVAGKASSGSTPFNEQNGNQVHDVTPIPKMPWTQTHSFYAIIGGFAIETSDLPGDQFLETYRYNDLSQLTLTSRSVLLLNELEMYPMPSLKSIQDRSKANYLAKGLVCLQAGWLVLQCISRLAEGLPITSLEINTLGHVICALLMYVFWWNKLSTSRSQLYLRMKPSARCVLSCLCTARAAPFQWAIYCIIKSLGIRSISQVYLLPKIPFARRGLRQVSKTRFRLRFPTHTSQPF